jgi:hypothetical protein
MFDETEEFLRFAFPAGSIVELRAAAPDGSWASGRFNDFGLMACNAEVGEAKGYATAIYYTLNVLKPDASYIGGEHINRVCRRASRTTRGSDGAGRTLYLIDVDPVRPSGVCSTDVEKAEAVAVAEKVQAFLTETGWPEPIRVDSGNGVHLLYRGEGAGYDAASDAWRYVLKTLADEFDTTGAKVDICVHNPARISRLPGTLNQKGENTPQRPHRRAHVLSYPEKWVPVQHGPMIYRLARKFGFEDVQQRIGKVTENRELVIDEEGVQNLIDEYPAILELHYEEQRGDDLYFFITCPFAGRMHKNDPTHTAIILGPDRIGFKCFSSDCADHTIGELRQLLFDKTGRWPSVPFYRRTDDAELTDADNKAWGLDPPSVKEREERLKATPEWQYDNATWLALSSPKFADCPLGTDPAEWGLTADDVYPFWFKEALKKLHDLEGCNDLETFRAECGAIFESRDPEAMGAFLGKKWLFLIGRSNDRPPEPESRFPKHYLSAEEFLERGGMTARQRSMITGSPAAPCSTSQFSAPRAED